MTSLLIAIAFGAGLAVLYIIGLVHNQQTPVPEGCVTLSGDCNSCSIDSCSVRKD